MSPVQRPIGGPALLVTLEHEMALLREQLATSSRSGRTILKEGTLRATLMGLSAGGTIAAHSAEGPITVQVLEGEVEFDAADHRWSLATGSLLALDTRVVHSVSSAGGGIFLLTVSLPPADDASVR